MENTNNKKVPEQVQYLTAFISEKMNKANEYGVSWDDGELENWINEYMQKNHRQII